MWKYLNRGISTPLAISIILILVVAVGSFTWWQYGEIEKEISNFSKIDFFEKYKEEVSDSEINDQDYEEEKREVSDIEWFYTGGYSLNCSIIEEENEYRYPNSCDEGNNNYQEETSQSDFYHIISIPFHDSDKILRAYLPIEAKELKDQMVRLIVYDKKNEESNFVGDVKVEGGSNYAGIFLPYQIVKDDSKVILKSCMGSPGAGGGSADLGYKTLSFENGDLNWVIPESGAHFYDSFGKVVYVSEGDNTPHDFRPGPPNNAAVYFRNIIQEKEEVLLEEKDSSYKIIGLNEESGILNLEVTNYYFSEDCPREDGNLYCAETSKKNRSINLP